MKKFLHSKVGRRIVILFVLCALLPITVMAALSFYEVSTQLREQSERQLSQASKGQAMQVYGQLEILDSELMAWFEGTREQSERSVPPPANHFTGLALFAPDGTVQAHSGKALRYPQLMPDQTQHLQSRNPLLAVEPCDRAINCVWLIHMPNAQASAKTLVVGELDLHHLSASEGLALGQRFCVLSSSRQALFESDGGCESALSLPELSHSSGMYQWRSGMTVYDAAYWKLLLKREFLEDSWTIIVSQDHADALRPMLRFRQTFPLVLLLSLWIVLLLSLVQIRRTLGPLEELREGTVRIAAQHFGTRVEIHSGDEFEILASSFNSMTTQLGRQFGTLKTINDINQSIFASLDREAIFDGVLSHMPSLLTAEFFGVCLFDEPRASGWMRFRDASGGAARTEKVSLTLTDWQQLQSNANSFAVSEGQKIPEYLLPLSRTGGKSFLVLPIRVEDVVGAALVCAHTSGDASRLEHTEGVRQVADQVGVALSHVRLIDALEQLQWGTLTALARAIDAKSQWTAGHSERVTTLAIEIGRTMGLSSRDLKIIHMGGLLHDVGKIGTPPEILDKPGKLTPQEMKIMQDHVRIGVRILDPIPGLREALPLVAQHHEAFNGKGYPEGLAGTQISLYGRILAVADCYDALTSDRPYRSGLPHQQTVAMIQSESGTHFDPDVVVAFLRLMATRLPQAATASAGQPS